MPEELLGHENIYETHDADMGDINNLGAEGVFVLPGCTDKELNTEESQEPREFDSTRQRSSEVWYLSKCLQTSHYLSRNLAKPAMLRSDLSQQEVPSI